MNPSLQQLLQSPLFGNLPAGESQSLHVRFQSYQKDEVIAFEEDECAAIGVVLRGSAHILRLYASGKSVTMDTLLPGHSFGEAVIFSDHSSYPATIVAAEEAQVAFIHKDEVVRLCRQSPAFLDHFLRLLSNKILTLNRKIKSLSYSSLKQKIAHLLLEECKRQGRNLLVLPYSRSQMAASLGIPRPSLSRELAAMQTAGLIRYERSLVEVLDRAGLERCLE